MKQIKKAQLITQFRKRSAQNDTADLKKQRERWVGKLLVQNFNPPLKVLEMYFNGKEEIIKSKIVIPQYQKNYQNTRTKILSETRAEIDKIEDFNKMLDIFCPILKSLMNNKIHFAVFYAEGQRSPHIIIYDFDELRELEPFQRLKAQAKFWRGVCPFAFHLLDQGIWDDDHYVPLEFAPHWKYGTPFKLMFEWIPETIPFKPKPKETQKKNWWSEDIKKSYEKPSQKIVKLCCGLPMFLLRFKNITTNIYCCVLCGNQEEICNS